MITAVIVSVAQNLLNVYVLQLTSSKTYFTL